MNYIQIGTLKSDFSAIIQSVRENGERFVVEYGKRHKKVAMIIPYDEKLEKQEGRKFGILQNRATFKMRDGFEMSDEELLKA